MFFLLFNIRKTNCEQVLAFIHQYEYVGSLKIIQAVIKSGFEMFSLAIKHTETLFLLLHFPQKSIFLSEFKSG